MRNMTETELTNIVLEGYAKTGDPRLKEILSSLIRHLHDFVREVRLTEAEWMAGIQYITAAGQISDDKRQEVILFSDLLGVSALVNMVSANVPEGATESTVIGPFYVKDAPEIGWGESIDKTGKGEPMILRGKVQGMNGEPVPNARIDIWQTDADGHYDIQSADIPENNLRGWYSTNDQGEFLIKTVRPTSYPIPVDGPAGDLVRAANRHPWRPAHVHAMIRADGYQELITHIFDGEDPYLDTDVVFAVKESLIFNFSQNTSAEDAAKYGLKSPFREMNQTFVLPAAKQTAA